MSQISFSQFFVKEILDFLWRQWSALGVAGGARSGDEWAIDPEALLLFSLEMGRYEPRFFDEILDWLVVNGKWIDIQRLRGIMKQKDERTQRLMSAVACFLSHEAGTYQRKWKTLALLHRVKASTQDEMLFKTKEGKPYPKPAMESNIFKEYGFLRESFTLRKMSKPVPVMPGHTIRFLLRALFGIGSRAECIWYLLSYGAGHPSEVAKAIGLSVRGTQDALIELAESGLVLTRIKGKRKIEYWLPRKRWWEFLYGMEYEDVKKPLWVDWISLYAALTNVWDVLGDIQKTRSDYMRSSKLRQAMEEISVRFLSSGLELSSVPSRNITANKYEQEFQNFIIRVLGAKSGASR